jgi:hypothetical protein
MRNERVRMVPRRRTMKLNLIFIVMDLMTLLAYPVVFVYGRFHQLSNQKKAVAVQV